MKESTAVYIGFIFRSFLLWPVKVDTPVWAVVERIMIRKMCVLFLPHQIINIYVSLTTLYILFLCIVGYFFVTSVRRDRSARVVRQLQPQPKHIAVMDTIVTKVMEFVPPVQLVPIPVVGHEEIPLRALNVRREHTNPN